MKVVCIIAAAGSGTRMGGKIKKQYRLLNKKPVIVHTLFAVAKSSVNSIILVVEKSKVQKAKKLVVKYKIPKVDFIVTGGATRAESVYSGVKCVTRDCDIVLIHDCARALVPRSLIEDVILGTKKYKSAVAAIKVTDTIKKADDDLFLKDTVDRKNLWQMQTPQGFSREIIEKIYSVDRDFKDVTDDSTLAQILGESVKIIEGDPCNIKITTEKDLKVAEAIMKIRNK